MANINGIVIDDDLLEKLGKIMSPEYLFNSGRNDVWEDFVREHPLPGGYSWKKIPELGKILEMTKQINPDTKTTIAKMLLKHRIEKHLFGKELKLSLKCQKIISHDNRRKAATYYRCLKNAANLPIFQEEPKMRNDLLVFAEVYQDAANGKLHRVFACKNTKVKPLTARILKKEKVTKIYDYLKSCLEIKPDAKRYEMKPNDTKPLMSINALSKIVAYFFPDQSPRTVKSMIFEE